MSTIPINIHKMLSSSKIPEQVLQATELLAKALGDNDVAKGHAYEICNTWQRRFETALRSEIPDWSGLVGFRSIIDFTIPIGENPEIFLPPFIRDKIGSNILDEVRSKNLIDTYEKCLAAYILFFEKSESIHSGKFTLSPGSEAEKFFIQNLSKFYHVLGGQAGNISLLWRYIGANVISYVPYVYQDLVKLWDKYPELKVLKVIRFENGTYIIETLNNIPPGVLRSDGCRVDAPSGGSIIIVKDGKRLIFQFSGTRDLYMNPEKPMSWNKVQFKYDDKDLLEGGSLTPNDNNDITWPSIPIFCQCIIDNNSKNLIIKPNNNEMIIKAFKGKVDFAIIGGTDMIFRDSWLQKDPKLQARLLTILEEQLETMASYGIRIGIEISGFPNRDYAHFIKRLCQRNIVIAIGINGVDELPDTVGKKIICDNQLYDFWLDPQSESKDLQDEIKDTKSQKEHFEYVTYLRAKKLAEATGVRTLYVHTMALDIILRKDADPGSLLRAQLADMMGKGLVIAALIKRAYGEKWLEVLKERMPLAIKPEAMVKLAKFAEDFDKYDGKEGTYGRVLHSGYWIAPNKNQYSMAVVPVMWPYIPETRTSENSTKDNPVQKLLKGLNATGSGDMTFGAFFFLGGV